MDKICLNCKNWDKSTNIEYQYPDQGIIADIHPCTLVCPLPLKNQLITLNMIYTNGFYDDLEYYCTDNGGPVMTTKEFSCSGFYPNKEQKVQMEKAKDLLEEFTNKNKNLTTWLSNKLKQFITKKNVFYHINEKQLVVITNANIGDNFTFIVTPICYDKVKKSWFMSQCKKHRTELSSLVEISQVFKGINDE